jgi:FtsP/CotA-like multicopper oxidase with cupredoxin domain
MFNTGNITPWKKPLTPLLQTKGECGAGGVPFITVPENATTVEVVINNLMPTAHVLHMHGMSFSVINYAPFSETWCSVNRPDCFSLNLAKAQKKDCPGARHADPLTNWSTGDVYWGCPYDPATDKKTQNLEAPLQKDMISIWRRSWVVIRFKATNPGAWLFHCHMEQHIPTGQIMAFNIKPSEQPPIPEDVPTEGPCPKWSDASPKHRPPKGPSYFV